MNALQPLMPSHLTPMDDPLDELTSVTLMTVAPGSQRIYAQTFRAWQAWAVEHGIDPLDLRPAHVLDYLNSQPTTKATRQRQLSALRKLAAMRQVLTPSESNRQIHEALKLIKAPVPETPTMERSRRALAPREADKLLRVWDGDTLADTRNRALVAVLLLGGVRRSEAAVLRWRDMDFENGIITVRHGKGDKSREVPLAGDYALIALAAWQQLQPTSREYVFCPLKRGDHPGKDQPISGTDVYRIWVATATAAKVESKPHDARRTLITEALATGTPLATVQAMAGHARGETTLRYAQAVDARRARKELKLRYG
jgi:integrase/recombinase XerD